MSFDQELSPYFYCQIHSECIEIFLSHSEALFSLLFKIIYEVLQLIHSSDPIFL